MRRIKYCVPVISLSLFTFHLSLPVSAASADQPRIAIVIDDFGLTYKKNVPDEEWMKLTWPVTFAVMPESPRTARAARETLEHGHELIIHFPFDPFLRLELPADRVSPADLSAVRSLLEKAFRQVPGAKGLNNHRSLRATENRPLMAAFMGLIKPKEIYFIDSHVSQKSVAFDEARKAGLNAARNFIFLEEPPRHMTKEFAERMLLRAAAHAKKKGYAVVIGHHYFHNTFEALQEEVPKLQAQGFRFVFASELARESGQ